MSWREDVVEGGFFVIDIGPLLSIAIGVKKEELARGELWQCCPELP
jgi:hypothetical protein